MPQQQLDDDFDAWYAETHQPYRFKLLGQTWELPPALPAVTVIRYRKLFAEIEKMPDDSTDLPDGFTEDELTQQGMIRGLVGDEMVDAWLEAGLVEEQLIRVGRKLMARYVLTGPMTDPELDTDDAPEGDEEGKDQTTSETSSTGSDSTGE